MLRARLGEPSPRIQLILGPRQVGKTTGVTELLKKHPKSVYASADDAAGLPTHWITEQWQAAKEASSSPLLVIDEIQKVEGWSDRIKAHWDKEQREKSAFKLVLLGSSSLHLARGAAESLAGRYELIRAHHWSLAESQRELGYDLEDYLSYGGYPGAKPYVRDHKRWKNYLRDSIVEAVIGRDILRLHSVGKPALFRQAFDLLCAYPAQEISYNKLLGQLQDKGNTDLIKHYIELFEGAFLFRSLAKFTASPLGRKSSSPKILPLCPALCTYGLDREELRDPQIRGRVLEAAVGADLARCDGELTYWRDGKFEVDFVFRQGRERVFAIEVKSGRRRSERGLEAFLKQFPKASPVFVTMENYEKFAKDPEAFLARVT